MNADKSVVIEPSSAGDGASSHKIVGTGLGALGLSALGIVFGDIGTSPLYTFKTVLGQIGGPVTPDHVLGVLSLIFWTLTIVTSIKYVGVAMSIDNDGEGGVMALLVAYFASRAHQATTQPAEREAQALRPNKRRMSSSAEKSQRRTCVGLSIVPRTQRARTLQLSR